MESRMAASSSMTRMRAFIVCCRRSGLALRAEREQLALAGARVIDVESQDVAGAGGARHLPEVGDRPNGRAVDLDDDVAVVEVSLVGGAERRDAGHQDPREGVGQPEPRPDLPRQLLDAQADAAFAILRRGWRRGLLRLVAE